MENKETEKEQKKPQKKYNLKELLKDCDDGNRHDEMITDIQGKEII